jgi:hypothetical protein
MSLISIRHYQTSYAEESLLHALMQLLQGSFNPVFSLINCKATQARLVAAELPKQWLYLIHIAATRC